VNAGTRDDRGGCVGGAGSRGAGAAASGAVHVAGFGRDLRSPSKARDAPGAVVCDLRGASGCDTGGCIRGIAGTAGALAAGVAAGSAMIPSRKVCRAFPSRMGTPEDALTTGPPARDEPSGSGSGILRATQDSTGCHRAAAGGKRCAPTRGPAGTFANRSAGSEVWIRGLAEPSGVLAGCGGNCGAKGIATAMDAGGAGGSTDWTATASCP